MAEAPETPTPPEPEAPNDGGGHGAVAVLLALAAVVGVALGGRASLVSSSATDAWQLALRQEIKRGAAEVEDVRYVYNSEAPIAFNYRAVKLRAQEIRQAAKTAPADAKATLELEAKALDVYAENLGGSIQKGLADDRYTTPAGGFDAAKRLADQRKRYPDLVAIDPDEAQRSGDRLSRQSILEMAATIPAGIAFLLGAVAEAFTRPRRWLLIAGFVLVAGACGIGIVVEAVYA